MFQVIKTLKPIRGKVSILTPLPPTALTCFYTFSMGNIRESEIGKESRCY